MDVKKLLGMLIILVLVITAFGCKKKEVLTPEDLAAAATDIREQTMEIPDDILSWGKSTLRLITDLKCDLQGETGIFSFKLVNPTEGTYTLKPVAALDTVSNPIKVKVNSRLFDYTYCRDGDGDISTVGPGDVRICTREFTPSDVIAGNFLIKTGLTKLGTPMENRLLVQSKDFTSEVLFKCD